MQHKNNINSDNKFKLHGGKREGAGRKSIQEVIESLNIKEKVEYWLSHTQSGMTEEGRYLYIVKNILLPQFLENGRLYLNRAQNNFYYFDNESKALFEIPIKFEQGTQFSLYVNEKYGLNSSKAGKYLIEELKTESLKSGIDTEIHKFTYYDTENCILYINKFDNRIYRLNGEDIKCIDNGTDGILFLANNYKPFEYIKNTNNEYKILLNVNFTSYGRLSTQDLKRLWHCSVLSKFFPQYLPTKPIDLFYGGKGSGKGVALKRLLWTIKGDKISLLNIPKSQRDFESQLTNNSFAFYDNMDEKVERWVKDGIASAATGYTVQMAKLYNTNVNAEFNANPYLGIATRTARFTEERDDLAERCLVYHVNSIGEKIPEEKLFMEIIKSRDNILSSLLNQCNNIIMNIKNRSNVEFNTKFRMQILQDLLLSDFRINGMKMKSFLKKCLLPNQIWLRKTLNYII